MRERYCGAYRFICLALLSAAYLFMGGCAGFKLVRIPIPIPTSGIGEHKIAQRTEKSQSTQEITEEGKLIEVGQASWYGRKFHGKPTASGETYSMYEMTAAHPTLPFNTQIKVTNLENGKVAYLRVNDRGPYSKGRILDVSQAAARELGFELKGIAQIKLETL